MKLMLLILSITFLGLFRPQETPSDFDSELSYIAQKFKIEILSEQECENQKKAADDLIDEIEDAIELEDEYTYEEILELKKLKKEAEALEQFIGAVGHCGNYIPSIEEFNLANRRVNAIVNYVIKDKYCIDIVLVEIDDYVAYLAKNNSSHNYKISYAWKAQNGMNRGNGTMGLMKYAMRHVYNNREKIKQKRILTYGITCKEF